MTTHGLHKITTREYDRLALTRETDEALDEFICNAMAARGLEIDEYSEDKDDGTWADLVRVALSDWNLDAVEEQDRRAECDSEERRAD